jgi:hypothetical protein
MMTPKQLALRRRLKRKIFPAVHADLVARFGRGSYAVSRWKVKAEMLLAHAVRRVA